MLADFALNIAAGLTQWLFEPQLDDWRRRINDPQRTAVKKVIETAARQMLRQVQSDLQQKRPDLGTGNYETLGNVLADYFALPQVASAVLEAAILRHPLDLERMHTHFRTVRAPARLTGIPFALDDCLPLFLTHLGEELSRSAQEVQSPLYNFWSVLVQADTHATAGRTLSEMQDFRLLLQQALLRIQSNYLWVNVPPKPAAPLLGRDALLDDLVARLLTGHSPALSTDGLPGVGKTALAVALAHDERVRAHCTDGVLWGGLGVNPDVVTIQNQWATAVGLDLADEPDIHRRAQRLSAAVGERWVLVVIDDAWTKEAAQAVRLSSPNVVHLLTTRDRVIARAFAGTTQQVHVPELAEEPAFALLERLAPEACKVDAAAAQALVKTVGELPLAIEVLGGYLAGPVLRKAQMDALAAMTDARQRLALAAQRLGDGGGHVQTLAEVVRLSVEDLPAAAQAVFWSLGAFAPRPATFDVAAAEAVTGAAVDVLDLLAQRNLVEVGAGETLAVHQVVHDVMAQEAPIEAVERHASYYLDLVNEDRSDWRRIESVYEQVRFAATAGDKVRFVDALATYQTRRGIWGDWLAWLAAALAQAQGAEDRSAEARMLHGHGFVYSALGDKRQALDYYAQALPLRRQVGDKGGEAVTLNNIGSVYSDLGDKRQALDYYAQALPLIRQVGDKGGEAITLLNAGVALWEMDDQAQSMERFQAFLQVCAMIDERVTTALGLGGWIARIQELFAAGDPPGQA
jgi:tetratricopeptide (TPR) repeat protein